MQRVIDRIRAFLTRGSSSAPDIEIVQEFGPARVTDWCLVGNIVGMHGSGSGRRDEAGTKHFAPGTKVYCLPPQWGDGYESCVVVGLGRNSDRLISMVIRTSLITNWRARVVYSPTVRKRLSLGFGEFNRQWATREEVEKVAAEMDRRL